MKITSFREVEGYIYAMLVLPLKQLDVPELGLSSPISEGGSTWHLGLYQQEISSNLRRNYQRNEARRNRNWILGMEVEGKVHIVGEYSVRNRWVRLYEQPFRELKSMPLLGKMYDVFDRDSMFPKVFIESTNSKLNVGPDDMFSQFNTHRSVRLEPSRPYRGDMQRVHSDMDMGYDGDEAVDEDEGYWDD